MGIDFGERRTGVALSDPTGTLASPLETLERRAGQRLPLKALEDIARANEVVALVVGVPLDLRGEDTEWTRRVRAAGDELVRSAGLPKVERERKERVDRAAAALILQDWLDRRSPDVPEDEP
jgi:putative Holliday junction resolvase